jgi:hypothetical protein
MIKLPEISQGNFLTDSPLTKKERQSMIQVMPTHEGGSGTAPGENRMSILSQMNKQTTQNMQA